MLRERVITAVILLVLFLLALFLLPDAGWSALVIVMVSTGASEWSRLARFSGRKANIFWGMTLVMMLGLVWFDAYHTPEQQALPHVLVYALSAVLWLVIVPTWLMVGWKVEQPLLMVLVGWIVLIPTGLAMLDLRGGHPMWLLGMMGLVWMADIWLTSPDASSEKTNSPPALVPARHGKVWRAQCLGSRRMCWWHGALADSALRYCRDCWWLPGAGSGWPCSAICLNPRSSARQG